MNDNLSSGAGFFQRQVLDFYRTAGREHLPWRQAGITAYEVWVSEIMLQQTQVSRVIGYYTRFLERFPCVNDLAQATWEEFLPYYAGLGYYNRGRNMLRTAHMVVSEYDGEFPRDKKLLTKLPGVGDYTASAILSFAYGDDHLAWDTNLKRVIGRFFFGTKDVSTVVLAGAELSLTAPKKELNAALMDFGSAICTGRPKCANCPLASRCVYYGQNGKAEQTKQKQKSDFPTREAQALVWLHENHKRYYSLRKTRFAPFVVPSAYNTRAGIKQFFRERYGLDVAVRPPHARMFVDKKPTMWVNAQILSGKPKFAVFAREAVAEYNKGMLNTSRHY